MIRCGVLFKDGTIVRLRAASLWRATVRAVRARRLTLDDVKRSWEIGERFDRAGNRRPPVPVELGENGGG